jgi:hypothetical protein
MDCVLPNAVPIVPDPRRSSYIVERKKERYYFLTRPAGKSDFQGEPRVSKQRRITIDFNENPRNARNATHFSYESNSNEFEESDLQE